MMTPLTTFNQWVEAARELLVKQTNVPLIDDAGISMETELYDARQYGDESLSSVVDNVYRDPDDLATRFVALNAYYRLANTEGPGDLREPDGSFSSRSWIGQDPMEHLGYLVRLREPISCTDVQTIRWEIVNAAAVGDYQRALALCAQLENLLPAEQYYYVCGRLHFLIALRERNINGPLEYWDLPVGETQSPAREFWQCAVAFGVYAMGLQEPRTRVRITEYETDHLRDAIKYLEKAINKGARASAVFMLVRSYVDIGDPGNAARLYRWMLGHLTELVEACRTEAGESHVELLEKNLRFRVHECLVNACDSAGELDTAVKAAESWIADFPAQPNPYKRMADVQRKRGDYRAAYEALRNGVDHNPALGEDPNISIIMALGGIVSLSGIDEIIDRLATKHHQEHEIARSVVRNHWPVFGKLCSDSQDQWINGAWLLGTTWIMHTISFPSTGFARLMPPVVE